MTKHPQDDDIKPRSEATPNASRRRMIGTVAMSAAAGMAVGMTGGVAVAQGSGTPATPKRIGARRFEGKVIVVTGGTSGIGRAATKAFAAEGGRVAFCGRREALGREVESEIKAAGGEAMYVQTDVLNEEDVKAFIAQTVARYGRLDVAFNNAGISIEKAVHEFSADEWDLVNNTNVRGVFLAMKYQIPHLIAAGGGTIVVTSSSTAIASAAKRSAYSASKRALIGLVQAAAFDYAPHNIRVNALMPGTTDTPFVRGLAGMNDAPDAIWKIGAKQWAKSHVPGLERMATAEEIASFALALASDEFTYMTGAQMIIDGGKTAHGG